jgi:ubiquinone/menaquinone biosynthesis C-methylase UbiE
MADDPVFRRDLYEGAAEDYDRYRLGYSEEMLHDLLERVTVSGRGWLLDLACGTGQIAFALADAFAEIWAVDQEPDMIRLVQDKALSGRVAHIRPIVSTAEELAGPAAAFELITVGNAFQRLPRKQVADSAAGWLRPGGHMAIIWAETPQHGDRPWQLAFSQALKEWTSAVAATDRVPGGWEESRRQRPDSVVMSEAGFEPLGRFSFTAMHRWSIDRLIGFVYSTSFLSRRVLGAETDGFEADLRARLGRYAQLLQTFEYAYELFRLK